MLNLPLSLNVIFLLKTTLFLTLLTSNMVSTASEPQRYPYILPKCCERNGNPPQVGSSGASAIRHNGLCGEEGSTILLLPKEFFPAMSTVLDFIEVEIQGLSEGLDCDEGHDTSSITVIHTEYGYKYSSDILVDLENLHTLTRTQVGKNYGFDEFAFSRDKLLSPDGNIYGPHHYCISSGTRNKTRLDIKVCKQECSRRSPCISRCCGGHQSMLTTPPDNLDVSLLPFCSSPSFGRHEWNPMTSRILKLDNRTSFNQKRYIPQIQGDLKQSFPPQTCKLFHFTEDMFKRRWAPFTLRNDGYIRMSFGDTQFRDNFCIDGLNGEEKRDSRGDLEDTCEIRQGGETVILYICGEYTSTTTAPIGNEEETLENEDDIISLPACSCLARPPNKLLQLPKGIFQERENEAENFEVLVRLTTGENSGVLECLQGYKDFTLDFNDFTAEISFGNDSLILPGTSLNKTEFCIRSVFQNSLGLRICEEKNNSIWDLLLGLLTFLLALLLIILYFPSLLLYMATAVVYILRKDINIVFRCSIVCSSISMASTYIFIPLVGILGEQSTFAKLYFKAGIMSFSIWHAFSWISVLCFDVWLNITFLSIGNKSGKRIWGYVVFAFTIPTIFAVAGHIDNILDHDGVPLIIFKFLVSLLIMGLFFISFLFFLAIIVKLWITQHSSGIKNQQNTFLLYVKLFVLVGVHSLLDFLAVLFFAFKEENYDTFGLGILLLKILHPIILFFLLVWDAETKRYLETNHHRVKKTLDFICLLLYPIRKCCGLCRLCKRTREHLRRRETEHAHCSTHMYVHRSGARNTPN